MSKKQTRTCECGAPGDFARGMCTHCYSSTRYKAQILRRWNPDRVDPVAAREHVDRLLAAGVPANQVARLAGINHSVLSRLPQAGFISRGTEAALLGVPVPEHGAEVVADASRVPVVGSVRRIQALVAYGYPQAQLARELGIQVASMRVLTGRPVPGPKVQGQEITAARHRQVKELFEKLQLQPGPSQKARDLGKAHGWALPMEWDEESIDDPDAKPVRAQRTPHTDRQDLLAERRERVLVEVHRGSTVPEIEARHGIPRRFAERVVAAAGGRDALQQSELAPEFEWSL
ncbi:hypothetical protein [Nocardia sp. CA-120079]|uniref:hypothetical protein n=1 Tax=Nocardia sp. CA-120079 TaxID=3239974 RepID=UPI003D965C74